MTTGVDEYLSSSGDEHLLDSLISEDGSRSPECTGRLFLHDLFERETRISDLVARVACPATHDEEEEEETSAGCLEAGSEQLCSRYADSVTHAPTGTEVPGASGTEPTHVGGQRVPGVREGADGKLPLFPTFAAFSS